MKTNLQGVITDSKFMFDKSHGFMMYVDISTEEKKGFAHCFKEPTMIRTLLEKAGDKSWSWMDSDLLIGHNVTYDYDENTNTCTLKTITFEEKYKVNEA